MNWRATAICAGLVAIPACGDPVVPTAYRGEPIAVFETQARVAQPPDRALLGGAERDFSIVIGWGQVGADFGDPGALVEQASSTTPASVAAPFMLNVFDAPEAHDERGIALGRVLAYADRDGDGRRGDDEPIIGASEGQGLLWVGEPVDAAESPTGGALSPGVHLVTLPIPTLCGLAPRPQADPTCTAPLGSPCTVDGDCAPGICLTTQVMWWPGGACGVASSTEDCVAPTGAFLPAAERVPGYRIAPCTTDADCGRDDAPYLCDRGVRGCVPDVGLWVRIGRAPTGSVFCGAPLADVTPTHPANDRPDRPPGRP